MTDEHFSPEESLRLIQTMIHKTRVGYSDKSHYFLLWGWAAFLAFLCQFILKTVYNYPYHYRVWWITIVCLVITGFFLQRDRHTEKAKTYVGENMGYLWTGMGATFFVLSMIFFKTGWQHCYPFFITLYGVGTFVSGKILHFPPLVWGGVTSWILACLCVWVPIDYQILFGAASILASYIVPGHLLRMKYH